MIIAVDGRLVGPPRAVALGVESDLRKIAEHEVDGSIYLGMGSCDLIQPEHPRPHVIVPLTGERALDAVEIDQLGHADAVVLMDETEANQLLHAVAPAAMLILVSTVEDSAAGRVIRTGNPFDAAEVAAFLHSCPALAMALQEHGVPIRPFSPRPITVAVLEGLAACAPPRASDSPPMPRIDSP
jgi:hypothetical protein